MKEIAYLLSIVIVMTAAVATEASEAKCREIARREYPNDAQMQQFTYNQQVAAYRYMQSVRDADVKAIAVREYHEDFAMQKFTYDQQSAAKRYMTTVRDAQVKQIALREYPHDYAMQKFTYDQQLAAKNYMATVRDAEIKKIALREYHADFAMQKFTYDQQLSAKQYMVPPALTASWHLPPSASPWHSWCKHSTSFPTIGNGHSDFAEPPRPLYHLPKLPADHNPALKY